MERFEVADVREAVELAASFRDHGRYDWFRGQTHERPPYPTLLRLQMLGDADGVGRNTRRIGMFCRWLRTTPQLAHLLNPERVHDLFAILQHYGIATYYLDFTTDPAVAGFFACDTKTPPNDGLSCIYCLNAPELLDIWQSVSRIASRKEARLERVVVDVENLWRLQAQAGVFLYVNYNWDVDYPMDRIVFPYQGYPVAPTRERIYPEDRSALEQLLDQYFDIENSTFTSEWLRERLVENRGDDGAYLTMDTFERGVYAPAFVDASSLTEHASWDEAKLEAWHVVVDERFHETVDRTIQLELGINGGAAAIAEAVRSGATQALRTEPELRSYAVDFLLRDAPASLDVARLAALLERAWNGMRCLPFTHEEIGECLGRVTLLHAGGFAQILHQQRPEYLAGLIGPVTRVDFGPKDGAGSAAWATRAALMDCLCDDIEELLVDEKKSSAGDIHELFKVIYNPRLMFEFGAFKRMFAREVIPIQVLDLRKFVHFNPATLENFGNP